MYERILTYLLGISSVYFSKCKQDLFASSITLHFKHGWFFSWPWSRHGMNYSVRIMWWNNVSGTICSLLFFYLSKKAKYMINNIIEENIIFMSSRAPSKQIIVFGGLFKFKIVTHWGTTTKCNKETSYYSNMHETFLSSGITGWADQNDHSHKLIHSLFMS